MARNILAGIDVGTHVVRVVVAELGKGAVLPHIIGTGYAESRGLRHGYVIHHHDALESVSAAVRAAEKSSGVKIKDTYLSIGGVSLESTVANGSSVSSRADGEVTDLDVEKALKSSEDSLGNIQNKKIIEVIPIRFKLDGKEVL